MALLLRLLALSLLLAVATPIRDVTDACSSQVNDEMGTKIDELEQSINDLKAEMGTEMPAKKPEEAKPADSA